MSTEAFLLSLDLKERIFLGFPPNFPKFDSLEREAQIVPYLFSCTTHIRDKVKASDRKKSIEL